MSNPASQEDIFNTGEMGQLISVHREVMSGRVPLQAVVAASWLKSRHHYYLFNVK